MTYVYVTATSTTRTYHDTETAAEQAARDIQAAHRNTGITPQVTVYRIKIDEPGRAA